MPVTLPPSVRQALGDPASNDFEEWIQETLNERTVTRDEYREVLSRLDVIENDIGHLRSDLQDFREEVHNRFQQIDNRFQQVNERFQQVDDRFQQVDDRFQQVDDRFQQVDERFQQVDERFQQVDERFQEMEKHFQHLNDRLDQTIRTMIRWTVGSLAFITALLTTLIAIAEFF